MGFINQKVGLDDQTGEILISRRKNEPVNEPENGPENATENIYIQKTRKETREKTRKKPVKLKQSQYIFYIAGFNV